MEAQDTTTSGRSGQAMTGLTGFSQSQEAQVHAQLATQLPFSNWGGIPTPDGLLNFYHNSLTHAAPWNALTPGAKNEHDAPVASIYRPTSGTAYRNNVDLISDCTSIPGDSGYGSRPPQSGGLPSRVCDDFPEVDRFENFHLGPQILEAPASHPVPAARSRANSDPKKFHCERPGCTLSCKTRSELKKHQQRHDKPYRCEVQNCRRTEGFSTKNDRQRHERTVHKITSADFHPYYCYYSPCSESPSPKAWPRADNFRQHLFRVHQVDKQADEDLTSFLVPPNLQMNAQHHHVGTFADSAGLNGIGAFEPIDNIPRPKILPDPILTPRRSSVSAQGMQTSKVEPPSGQHGYYESMVNTNEFYDGDVPSLPDLFAQKPERSLPGTAQSAFSTHPNSWFHLQVQSAQVDMQHRLGDHKEGKADKDNRADRSQRRTDAGLSHVQCEAAQDINIETASLSDDSDDPDSPQSISLDQSAAAPRPELREMVNVLSDLAASKRQPEKNATSIAEELKKLLPPEVLLSTIQALLGDAALPKKEAVESRQAYPCETCSKSFPRKCELKKHQKRHEKPYGCTFKGCGRDFGSKNDWKRHESSQHLQLETWSCDFAPCDKVCTRRESFKNHLIKDHGVNGEGALDRQLEKRRLGRHCDPQYWCGFCKSVQFITQKGVNCWTVRCDHIDDHICGRNGQQKRPMSEWAYLEDGSRPGTPVQELGKDPVDDEQPQMQTKSARNRSLKRKTEILDDPRPRKQSQMQVENSRRVWICCQCVDSPLNTKLNGSCAKCEHLECTHCRTERQHISEEQHKKAPGSVA